MAASQMSGESSSASESEFDWKWHAASLEHVDSLSEAHVGIVFQETPTPAVIESLLKSLSDREVANCALVCKSWRIYTKKILDRREKRMCSLFVWQPCEEGCTELVAGQDQDLAMSTVRQPILIVVLSRLRSRPTKFGAYDFYLAHSFRDLCINFIDEKPACADALA